MKNKKITYKILTGVLAGGILVYSNSLVYATTINSKVSFTEPIPSEVPENREPNHRFSIEELKARLDILVKDKTISGEQAIKILDLAREKQSEKELEMEKVKNMSQAEKRDYFYKKHNQESNLFDSAVKRGILTQVEADSVKRVLPVP